MSMLPPVGNPIKTGSEPERAFGQQGEQFTKTAIEKRKGVKDRRVLESSGGRRVNDPERRRVVDERTAAEAEAKTEASQQPVHVGDAEGHLQPNPQAPVIGVSDADRLQDAVRSGVATGTEELGDRGLAPGGVAQVTHVPGSNAPMGEVGPSASTSERVAQSVESRDMGHEEKAAEPFRSQFAQRTETAHGDNRRVGQRRVSAVEYAHENRRVAVLDRRGATTTGVSLS